MNYVLEEFSLYDAQSNKAIGLLPSPGREEDTRRDRMRGVNRRLDDRVMRISGGVNPTESSASSHSFILSFMAGANYLSDLLVAICRDQYHVK